MKSHFPCNALIVDSDEDRRESIAKYLEDCGLRCDRRQGIVLSEVTACEAEDLVHIDWDGIDLLLIHMGPILKVRRGDKKMGYGNPCSLEFYLVNRNFLEERCVVAYTAGDKPEPSQFRDAKRQGWHRFFQRVSLASDLNFQSFLNNWPQSPGAQPPLDRLESWSELVTAFKILIAGYQHAHQGNGATELRSAGIALLHANAETKRWTESIEWWKPVLAGDFKGGRLLRELEQIGETELAQIATALEKWGTLAAKDDKARALAQMEVSRLLGKVTLWRPRS